VPAAIAVKNLIKKTRLLIPTPWQSRYDKTQSSSVSKRGIGAVFPEIVEGRREGAAPAPL
jgi:hypothetical protein